MQPPEVTKLKCTNSEEVIKNYLILSAFVDGDIDLRDPSVVPLNFTKSINLALSERGINSLKKANRLNLLASVLRQTIPMYGRMIHGEEHGRLVEKSQAYDIRGRVCLIEYVVWLFSLIFFSRLVYPRC
jgi:hypothetical protein